MSPIRHHKSGLWGLERCLRCKTNPWFKTPRATVPKIYRMNGKRYSIISILCQIYIRINCPKVQSRIINGCLMGLGSLWLLKSTVCHGLHLIQPGVKTPEGAFECHMMKMKWWWELHFATADTLTFYFVCSFKWCQIFSGLKMASCQSTNIKKLPKVISYDFIRWAFFLYFSQKFCWK